MFNSFLRNRVTCIKYTYSDSVSNFIRNKTIFYFNDFIILNMIYRITKIISYYLFCFKLICPHKNRWRILQFQFYFVLVNNNICRLNKISNECSYIKPLHRNHIISKFQLIEVKKLSDHSVHLISFIYYYITVKIPCIRISIINSLFQAFSITLNKCNRSFEFM